MSIENLRNTVNIGKLNSWVPPIDSTRIMILIKMLRLKNLNLMDW